MNPKDRRSVYTAAEGVSDSTGEPLGDNWHVDHIRPKAAGGSDEMTNLQALTSTENITKSSSNPPPLRDWQQRFVQTWDRHSDSNFLLVALPGSGKTIAALTVARSWVRANPGRRRVLVIVPTDALRTQWRDEAHGWFGLELQTKEFAGFKSSMHGGVMTYHFIANNTAVIRGMCARHEVLVICDEIHHAGDENTWGQSLREALEPASKRLLMSGTPFREDGRPIPFVRYDGQGQSWAHERYDYPEAVRDDVVRIVKFEHHRGAVRRLTANGEATLELNSKSGNGEETDRLLNEVITPSAFTEALLRTANDQLLRCRKFMPNAGGLVICRDQLHAQQIAAQMFSVLKVRPDVVVSDDDAATSTVQEYRDSDRQWVVAVKKISEGVDIKRLMVLVYLTNTRTELFFRQAVGRIVRRMHTEHDMESYCFIPDHPALVEFALHIMDAQARALQMDIEEERDKRKDGERQPGLLSDIVLGTTHGGVAGTIIDGESINDEEIRFARQMAERSGVSEKWVIEIRRAALAEALVPGRSPVAVEARTSSLEEQLESKRKDLHKVIQRRRFEWNIEPQSAWRVCHQHVGKWKVAEYSLDDLHKAIKFMGSVQL